MRSHRLFEIKQLQQCVLSPLAIYARSKTRYPNNVRSVFNVHISVNEIRPSNFSAALTPDFSLETADSISHSRNKTKETFKPRE